MEADLNIRNYIYKYLEYLGDVDANMQNYEPRTPNNLLERT